MRKSRNAMTVGALCAMVVMNGPSAALAGEEANETALILSQEGEHGIIGECSAHLAFSADLTHMTVLVESHAVAYSTIPGVIPLAMSTRCEVVDAGTGQVYGATTGSGVGPAAIGFGMYTLPQRPFSLRFCASAVFSDGGYATTCSA